MPKSLGKYVEFVAYPKSIDEIIAPSKEELNRLRFNNVTIPLANKYKL